MLVAIDVQHDVVKQRAQQLFAIAIAGCARAPHLADLAGETAQRPPLRIGQRRRPLPVNLGQHAALPLGLSERLLPGGLQRSGNEPVLLNVFAVYALMAAAAGFLLGAATWAIGGRVGNEFTAVGGKLGMVTSLAVAFLVGAAATILNFAFGLG